MRLASVGAGPAALYFAILRKKAHPEDDIVLYERNLPMQTFGWGVVFAMRRSRTSKPPTNHARRHRQAFCHWDSSTSSSRACIHSTGHGFAGLSRRELLGILQKRAAEVGVRMEFERESTTRPSNASLETPISSSGPTA